MKADTAPPNPNPNDLLPPPPPFPMEAKRDPATLPDFRNTPPDNRPFSLGKYVMPGPTEPGVVVTTPVGKSDWTRLWGNNLDLSFGPQIRRHARLQGRSAAQRAMYR